MVRSVKPNNDKYVYSRVEVKFIVDFTATIPGQIQLTPIMNEPKCSIDTSKNTA